MNEEIHRGLMKEGSLSARIYFLLLDKPLTQSDISKRVYNGKVQLTNIKKNIEDLEKEGYVKQVGREVGKGKNYNRLYYKSTLKPLMEFIRGQVEYRSKTSKSKRKGEITSNEITFLEIFLISDWFRRFYSQKYMNLDLECDGKPNNRYCSCPIRFFARLLEEMFVITENFGVYDFSLNKETLNISDFDEFIFEKKKQISETEKKLIKKIVRTAKHCLGNYDKTNGTLDFYFNNYGVLFLPYSLSKKLSTLGRIPLTVSNAFCTALEESL